jgi:excisionase family DNA binding protein
MPKEIVEMLPIEAARRLGISLEYCYRLIWLGKLRAYKVGRSWRVAAESVDQRLRAQKIIEDLRGAQTAYSSRSRSTASDSAAAA